MGKSNTIGSATSSTSPQSNQLGTTVVVQTDVIPVIFIPGIMGSNVADKKGKNVWTVPNLNGPTTAAVSTLRNRVYKTPDELQIELDYKNTQVDSTGYIAVDPKLGLSEKQLRARGWGTVDMFSYAEILQFLQLHLNNIAFEKPSPPKMNKTFGDAMDMRAERMIYTKQLEQYHKATAYIDNWLSVLDSNEQKKWNPLLNFVPISKANIDHLKKFSFPVYALGYNWLQSNKDSASLIAKDLAKIKADLGSSFRKFIIVSHSMGGLVTRQLIKTMGADIAGVVHGVMPADGAAAAYRRIVAGSWEGQNKITGIKDYIGANVIGLHTESVTAVLANSPGGLELLPNQQYNAGKPWLHLIGKDTQGNLKKVSYPQKRDPYTEIYKKHGVWWEMVKEELIDPANMISVKPGELKKQVYFKKIDFVSEFHQSIIDSYHPCTYVHWGNNPKSSFATLTWTLSQNVSGMNETQLAFLPRSSREEINVAKKKELFKLVEAGGRGRIDPKKTGEINDGIRYITLNNGNLVYFYISMQDEGGDGTVPSISGKSPFLQKKVPMKQAFEMQGFGHQDNYQNINVQRSVLYSIVSIIKDNNIQPRNR